MADRLAASSGCTRLRVVVVSEELRAAAACAFAARNARIDNRSGATKPAFNPARFRKWQVVAAAAHDVVIFADADLELDARRGHRNRARARSVAPHAILAKP